jgi:hypothetical protein
MDWQYKHMQSIQNRINEWQEWEESQTNSGSQQMQDVNTQKLDNVRTFIKSVGWSDDVAQGAYVVNMHFSLLLAFWGSLGSGVVAILAIGGIIFVVSKK